MLSLCPVWAQEKAGEKSFIEHLNMPVEIGMARAVGDAFDLGLSFRTCLEYRSHKNHGWNAAVEYDEYDMRFQDYRFEGANTTAGTFSATNFFLGGGYRWALVKEAGRRDDTRVFSLSAMLQPGISFSSVEKVTGSDPDFHLTKVRHSNAAMKATLQLDYLFVEYLGIFISQSYTQPLGHSLMPARDSGVFCTSIGLTSFF